MSLRPTKQGASLQQQGPVKLYLSLAHPRTDTAGPRSRRGDGPHTSRALTEKAEKDPEAQPCETGSFVLISTIE